MSHDAYSALSDPTRRRILAVLHGGGRPVGDLVTELGVSQPTVSKHLKVLRDAGMVTTRAEGQRRFYSIVPEPFVPVVQWLTDLVSGAATADGGVPGAAPVAERELGASTPDSLLDSQPTSGTPEVPGPQASPGVAEDAEQRSMPWFTAEVAEVAATPADSADTHPAEVPTTEAPTAEEGGVEVGGADEVRGGVVEPAAADGATAGPENSAASVGDDVRAESAAQLPAERQDEPRDIHTRGALEEIEASGNEEMMRPRGGAHRRQSGLLSTLTGFRRRGRGSRRD